MGRIRVVNKMPQFVQGVEQRTAKAVTQALILGASEASVLTPIDTSTLINSQFRHVEQRGRKVVGTVGYTADYAMPVHDPDVKQVFRRASAEKEFLKKGFERQRRNIDAVVMGTLKPRK